MHHWKLSSIQLIQVEMQTCSVLHIATCFFSHFLGTTSTSPTQLSFTPPNRSIKMNKAPLKVHNTDEREKREKLVLIRHGCTYTNEYLSKPGNRWRDANRLWRWQFATVLCDSPLSKDGIEQAERLMELLSSCPERKALLEDIDIAVFSPSQEPFKRWSWHCNHI